MDLVTILPTHIAPYVYLRVSFSVVDTIISKEEEIFGSKILMMETPIFFLGLKVWLFGG